MMKSSTNEQFDFVMAECRQLFLNKLDDYGASWRVFRPRAIQDQLLIKVQRIRTIQEQKTNKVGDSVHDEFTAIVNYTHIALIQLKLGYVETPKDNELKLITDLYNHYTTEAKRLMEAKNHDYGEAWRSMSQEGITDLILVKLNRIKQIEQNNHVTKVSEGIDANYLDILNYAIFSLIKINEGEED